MDVTILTPERQLPSHKADSLVVPAHDGERGFLPGHTAMVCQLGSGNLTIDHALNQVWSMWSMVGSSKSITIKSLF